MTIHIMSGKDANAMKRFLLFAQMQEYRWLHSGQIMA